MLAGLQAQLDAALPGNDAGLAPYELDTPCLPFSDQAALLIEFARHRGVDLPPLQALQPLPALLSPRRLLALLAPLRESGGADAAFLLGQLLLPGHYGLASQALQQAKNLADALHLLCRHAGRLTPLLTPRLLVDERELILVWTEACGAPAQLRGFLVDLHMSAVTALCESLGSARLPWRYSFNRTAPRDLAQHAVHLGPALRFGCQADTMRIARSHAERPWRGAVLSSVARLALERYADPQALARPLLAALADRLLREIAAPPSLEALATGFGMSPATLKRRLATHGTHYQAELDRLRAHVALYLLGPLGQSHESVAQALGYFDAANFRRSFKRWTGLTPGAWAVQPS